MPSPLRNIALIGPAGSGKTTLCEMLLQAAGAIAHAGSVERGTTISSSDALEREMGHTLEPWICVAETEGLRLQLIDTPGYFDLLGRTLAILPAVDAVLLVIAANQAMDVVAERLLAAVRTRGLDCFIVINKIDADPQAAAKMLQTLQQQIGKHCLPLNLPAEDARVLDCYFAPQNELSLCGDLQAAHDALIDQVVEVDEALMARYLEQGENLQAEQLHDAFEKALRDAHIMPVCFASARSGSGVRELLKIITALAPAPEEGNPPQFFRTGDGSGESGGESKPVAINGRADAHVLAHVFRVSIDPYVGRIAWLRVHQGSLRNGQQLFIGDARKAFKLAHLLRLQGKQTREIVEAGPGDIVAISKIDELVYDAVVHDSHDEDHYHLAAMKMPAPVYGLALQPTRHGDEQKLSDVLHKLVAEDPSLKVEHREQMNETVLLGLGELHLKVALAKMQRLAQLDLETRPPAVPYRETISMRAEGFCRHKKQSGGAGQFGEVSLRIEPLARGAGFEFVDEVVGGAIPGVFIPSVEKGVREVLHSGAIAGFPLTDLRVIVVDGKHHSVDSKDIAFVSAGRKALLDAIDKARATLLEPVLTLHIECSAAHVGDLSGEVTTRRGLILGTDIDAAQHVLLRAQLPMAELGGFQTRLKSLTGGSGRYTMDLSHYDVVPGHVQQQLIGKYKRREEE